MARSVNKVIIVGHIGNTPEIRYTNSGKAVANFSVATNSEWKNQDGTENKQTEWHRMVAWDKLAEIIGQYMSKGTLVYVEGKLQTRKWTDNNNIERYVTEIVVRDIQNLSPNPNTNQNQQNYQQQPPQQQPPQQQPPQQQPPQQQPPQQQPPQQQPPQGASTPPPQTPFDDDVPF